MKDLDFDELDRAVNSLISSAPGSGSDSLIPNSATPVIKDAPLTIEYNPPVSDPVQSISSILPTVPIVTPMPVVERPTTGRFMDVVRSSSDMRSSLMMPERPSNQITPVSVPNAPLIPEEPSFPAEITEPSVPSQINSAWPDPIDFDSKKTEPEIKSNEEDDDIDRISNDIANTLGQKPIESMDSPFLSDAKVEKRPLGAFSVDQNLTQPTQTIVPTYDSSINQPSDVMSTEKPIEKDTPLPAELQDDLLSIESDSTTIQPEKPAAIEVPISFSQPIDNPATIPTTPITPITPITPTAPVVTASVSTTIPAATSIAPQYKEQPSTGDQKNGAIYDTNAYNKPLNTPKKKKTGLKWAIWITLFLIIGVAIGAAVYFFVLPRL